MAKRRHRRGRRKKGNWFSRLTIGKKIGVCFGGLILALASSGVVYVAAKLGQLDTQEIPKEDIVINEGVEQLATRRRISECCFIWCRFPEKGIWKKTRERTVSLLPV